MKEIKEMILLILLLIIFVVSLVMVIFVPFDYMAYKSYKSLTGENNITYGQWFWNSEFIKNSYVIKNVKVEMKK